MNEVSWGGGGGFYQFIFVVYRQSAKKEKSQRIQRFHKTSFLWRKHQNRKRARFLGDTKYKNCSLSKYSTTSIFLYEDEGLLNIPEGLLNIPEGLPSAVDIRQE